MKKIKIYLDTSVINFLYADDAPEFQSITEDFFQIVKDGKSFTVYISDAVINEIAKTNDDGKRYKLLSVVKDYGLMRLPADKDAEVAKLAEIYLNKGIVPMTKVEDALHIAYAVIFEMDVLLSWNFKHLANIKREKAVLLTNMENGYKLSDKDSNSFGGRL